MRVEDCVPDPIIFWIQIHGPQINHLSMNNVNKLGAQVELILVVDLVKSSNRACRSFLRVKVKVDCTKPLTSRVWVHRCYGDRY